VLKGLDDYMILDEQVFRINTDEGTLLVLNFEFLLVLNHDDVTWDYPKRGNLRKRKRFLGHTFLGRVKKVVGTCSRKLQIYFDISQILIVVLSFFNKL
jgi:hypothetical protein